MFFFSISLFDFCIIQKSTLIYLRSFYGPLPHFGLPKIDFRSSGVLPIRYSYCNNNNYHSESSLIHLRSSYSLLTHFLVKYWGPYDRLVCST